MTKTERVTEPKEFFNYLDSTKYEVSDARIVNDDTVEVHYTNTEEFIEQDNKTNIVIAAFTTAYARLKLYDLLDLLQERVLYYDTDSVIYVHEPGKPDPPMGDYLRDLTDELDPGDYITTFISGGPKNYAYLTNNGKTETKIRGITLNYDSSDGRVDLTQTHAPIPRQRDPAWKWVYNPYIHAPKGPISLHPRANTIPRGNGSIIPTSTHQRGLYPYIHAPTRSRVEMGL